MTWQRLLGVGFALAALAVAAGAFGAHGLKKRLSAEMLAIFETGAQYHMYGALATVGLALAAAHGVRATGPGWLVVAGTVIFAGTLYLLAITGTRWLGAITPIGGTLMLVGLAWAGVVALTAR